MERLILRAALTLSISFIVFCLSASQGVSQTSIVAVRTNQEVVIGADSKRVVTEYNESGVVSVSQQTVCKIHPANGFFFGCSGPCVQTGVVALMQTATAVPGSIESRVRNAIPRLESALSELLTSDRAKGGHGHFSGDPKANVLGIMVVGVEQGVPFMIGFDLYNRGSLGGRVLVKAGDVAVCPAEAEDTCRMSAIGHSNAIRRFLSKATNRQFITDASPAAAVKKLIELEVAEESQSVGPPIEILRLRSDGTVSWVCKQSCKQDNGGVDCSRPTQPTRRKVPTRRR